MIMIMRLLQMGATMSRQSAHCVHAHVHAYMCTCIHSTPNLPAKIIPIKIC